MKTTSPILSVIIPAYNEESNIEYIISDIRKALNKIGQSSEIIVVDDGSEDFTGEIAREFGAKVVRLNRNSGYGKALMAGFREAKGDIFVIIDANGKYTPEEIQQLIEPLRAGADIVSGTRFSKESKVRPYSIGKFAYLGNLLLDFSIRVLEGKRVSDTMSGFKAFKRKIIEGLDLESPSFEIAIEITMKSLSKGFQYREVPITYRTRYSISVSPLKIVCDAARLMKTIFRNV